MFTQTKTQLQYLALLWGEHAQILAQALHLFTRHEAFGNFILI